MSERTPGAALEQRVSDNDIALELRWHVAYGDDDTRIPCATCADDEVPCIVDLRDARAEIARLEAIVQHFAEDTCGWGDAVRDELDTYMRTPVCSYCGGASQHSYRYPHPEGWTPTQGGTDAPR